MRTRLNGSLSCVPLALGKASAIDAFISPTRTCNLKPEKSSIVMALNIFSRERRSHPFTAMLLSQRDLLLLFYLSRTGGWLHNSTFNLASRHSFLLLWILTWEHCSYFRYLGKVSFLDDAGTSCVLKISCWWPSSGWSAHWQLNSDE